MCVCSHPHAGIYLQDTKKDEYASVDTLGTNSQSQFLTNYSAKRTDEALFICFVLLI